MPIDRRGFLVQGASALGASALSTSCASDPFATAVLPGADRFPHGVASGDPLVDRVILWTRVSPLAAEHVPGVPVDWWIARDEAGLDRINEGEALATSARDFTVKIDATGLTPGTDYYYGFATSGADPGSRSRVGRTRTLPDQQASHVRLAFASCANYPYGFFNAYANLALRDDVDVVLHLGDYLYEYANGEYGDGTAIGRVPAPLHETLSLSDYRLRHATYKRDEDLQAAHARHPWITVWDDHESANNSTLRDAENHSPESEGEWSVRRLAAIRAYHEWMPIRDLPTGIFRSFRFGDLLDLVMLDTRLHGRDEIPPRDLAEASDPTRTLLGQDQTAWLLDTLTDSKAAKTLWRVVGQQVIFSPVSYDGVDFNPDGWDGYRANRREILTHLASEGIGDVIFLTGDVHSSWVFEVPGEPQAVVSGADSISLAIDRAAEFVVPAVSSPALGSKAKNAEILARVEDFTPHLRFRELTQQGYAILDLNRERAQVEYVYMDPATTRSNRSPGGPVFERVRGDGAIRILKDWQQSS